MQYNRLISSEAIVKKFKDLENKIKGLETKGTGTISWVDPNDGVETIIGELPDGTVGLAEFVNDVVPPGKPSNPIATGLLESISITWDGLIDGGLSQPKDYSRTVIEFHNGNNVWAPAGTVYDTSETIIPSLDPDLTYSFRLISYDTNNNASEPSITVTASPTALLDNTEIDAQLDDLRQEDLRLSGVASGAAEDAEQALQDLIVLNDALNTTNTNLDALTQPGGVLDDMQDDIDGKITTHYGPAPTVKDTGDLWLDATDPLNQVLKRWDGDSWEVFDNPRVQEAYSKAGEALTAADTKIQTFAQTTQPTGLTSPSNDGDLWINTSVGALNGQIKRFHTNAWTLVNDNGASAAATAKAEAIAAAAAGEKVPSKWLYSFVDGYLGAFPPTPSDFTTPGVVRSFISEGANLIVNVDETYRGSLRTMVRVDTTRTIAFTALHDDAGAVYVDGTKIYSANGMAVSASISFSLTAGWHMIELLWAENAGGDGWSNISPTIGSQVNELAAPSLAAAAQWDAALVQTVAAADATAKSDAAKAVAIAAQAYTVNPSFDDWPSTVPTGYTVWSSTTYTKDTTNKRIGTQGLQMVAAANGDNRGIAFGGALIGHAPNLEYFTVEVEFMLTSGTSLQGAGVLLDWAGLTPQRAVWKFADSVVGTPTLNKWYRMSKTLRRPTSTGTFTGMGGYLMANYAENGTPTAKTMTFDWFNVRPATAEEIIAYNAPTDIAAKGKVIIQSAAPAVADRLIQNLWIDTTSIGNPAAPGNIPKRWNTTSGQWEAVTEKAIVDAAQAAANAQTAADEKIKTYADTVAPTGLTVLDTGDLWINTNTGALNGQIKRWDGDSWELVVDSGTNSANSVLTSLGINQAWVDDIETQSDRAIATFYGTDTPVDPQDGDLWLTGVAGEPMKRRSGGAWNTFEDPNIAAAYTRAGEALTAADSKILTYAQATAPGGLTTSNNGDLWIDTDNGHIHRYTHPNWTEVVDNGVSAANAALAGLGINQTWVDDIEAQADRAIATFYGTGNPTGMQTGDLWLSGVAGTPMKRWDGDSWEIFEDPNVQAAYQKAGEALSAADTKILTHTGTTAPTGLTSPSNDGDLWIDTSTGSTKGQISRFFNNAWTLVNDNGIAAASAALTALGINQAWVDTIEAQGDRAIATFFGPANPEGMDTGDLWLAGTAGVPMKRWDGDSWEVFEDPNVQAAYQKASEAQSAADAKILTYAQATAPTGLDTLNNGDLWIDTDNGHVHRYTHPNWVEVVDNGTAAANAALIALGINQTWVDDIETQADRAIATFYGPGNPTGMQTGDLWVSGTAGVPMKRWDGDSWEAFEDPNVMAAYNLADQAKTDANAKILTYAQTTAPTGLTADNNGDLWINTTAGPLYGQIKRYTHPTWVLVSDNGVLASQNTVAFSGNPSFDDWTSTNPNGYSAFTTSPTKETTILTKGSATAARWNVTASGTQAGLSFSAGLVSGHLPNLEYFTVELDFYLVSGVLTGAGIILDWNGTSMTNNRTQVHLATEYPTVDLGKWYRMTKVFRRPTNITGTWSSMGGFVLANWSGFGAGVKDIIIDWFNIRPSTAEEIKAYLAPTSADVAAKGKVIIQSAAPAVADRLVQNLWIDTTPIGNPASPGNIPKRWNTTTTQWEAVTEKAIIDAAAAAVAAQGDADQALIDAGLALTAANARNRIVHLNTTPAVPTDGWKNGDTWFKHETADVSSPVLEWYRWSTADNAWKLQEFDETFLPQVNIGTGTYGNMSGVRLEAGTIEVTKLAVSDFTNLWPNPLFKLDDTGSIFYYVGTSYSGAEVAPLGNIRQLSARDHIASAGNITAKAGDSFLVEADIKRTAGTLPLRAGVWSYKADGTSTTAGSPENFVVAELEPVALANGWERTRWVVKTDDLPSDTTSVRLYFQIDQAATGGTTTWLVSNTALRRRGGGELLVDGAVTGRVLSGDAINGKTIDGVTITGAEVRTAGDVETGVRAQMSQFAVSNLAGTSRPGFGFVKPDGTTSKIGMFSEDAVKLSLVGSMSGMGFPETYVDMDRDQTHIHNPSEIILATDGFMQGALRVQTTYIDLDASEHNGKGVQTNGHRIDVQRWFNLTLSGSWTAYTGGGNYFQGLRYRREGSNVRIQGMIKNGTVPSTIATIPPSPVNDIGEYLPDRPDYTGLYLCAAGTAASPRQVSYIVVGNNGVITYDAGPSAPSFVSIDISVPMHLP